MGTSADFRVQSWVDAAAFITLADILPQRGPIPLLLVGKVPTPISVEVGHYFQGRHGQMFWNRLVQHGLLRLRQGAFEDEVLLEHGYGMTDIVKRPRPFGEEPTCDEYRLGATRIMSLIADLRPKVVCFAYKAILDNVLKVQFAIKEKSLYGFNANAEGLFGCRVFVFPMPGTPCPRALAAKAMAELRAAVEAETGSGQVAQGS